MASLMNIAEVIFMYIFCESDVFEANSLCGCLFSPEECYHDIPSV